MDLDSPSAGTSPPGSRVPPGKDVTAAKKVHLEVPFLTPYRQTAALPCATITAVDPTHLANHVTYITGGTATCQGQKNRVNLT